MADIGARNRLFRFYKRSEEVNAANEPVGWVFHKQKWAEVKGESGMGSIRAAASAGGVVTPLDRYSLRVSYDLSIDSTMQARDSEGWCYEVLAVRHDKARRNYSDIVVESSGMTEPDGS